MDVMLVDVFHGRRRHRGLRRGSGSFGWGDRSSDRAIGGPAAHLPVTFLTAKPQKQEVERYLALGATCVVVKPIEVVTFAAEIRRIVEDG